MVARWKCIWLGILVLGLWIFSSPIHAADWVTGDADIDARMAAGEAAYDAGEYEKAKSILLPLAELDHPKAMNIIGLMHDFGRGYPKNWTLGCDWFQRGAQLGYVSAEHNFSLCFYHGAGRPQDLKKAVFWATRAAERGSKNAQSGLASHYIHLDRERYLYWALRAVANGSVKAKALMWSNDDGDLVPEITIWDFACVVVMIGWFDQRDDYCD